MFRSNEINVQNSIDPFYIEDAGKKFLFWGSFRGIYGIELSEDGLSVKQGEKLGRWLVQLMKELIFIKKKVFTIFLLP